MTVSPTLTTDRLVLREPVFEDWPPFAEVVQSDRARFMGGPYSEAGAWGVFCHGIANWRLFELGSLTIELRGTQTFLGQVEINGGPLFPEAELGWQLAAHAEGHGYACEAAIALRDWAFCERGLESLVSYIDPENVRSIQLAERLGAKLDPNAPKQDPEDLVYRHRPASD